MQPFVSRLTPRRKRLDDGCLVQRRDLVRAVSGLGQHGIGVLAQARRQPLGLAAAMRQLEAGAGEAERTVRRIDLLQGLAGLQLWMVDDLLDPPDIGARSARGVEDLLPLLRA